MGEREELRSSDIVWCPMPGQDICHQAVYEDKTRQKCAWWIPGAECCAITYLARKLGNLAATAWIEVERREPAIPATPM